MHVVRIVLFATIFVLSAATYSVTGKIYVRTWRVRNGYRMGHGHILCNYFLIDAFMLQPDGRAPNAARCDAVADDSFPVLATLMTPSVKYKLRPRAVHGEGSLFHN